MIAAVLTKIRFTY